MFTTELMAKRMSYMYLLCDLLDADIDSFFVVVFFGKLFAHPRYAMQIQNKPRSTLHNHVYILFKQS
jgi:hypothetical protein